MAQARRVELDDLVNRPGTYFNPQTEVVIVVDDSPEIDAEIFDMEELEGASGQGPFAFERLLSTLDEQHLIFEDDDGSNANDRSLRIFASHQDKTKSSRACRTLRQRRCAPC